MSEDKQQTDAQRVAAFERRAREVLSASAERLDGRIRSKLTQARFAAVEQAQKRRHAPVWRTWIPAGAMAGVAALAVLLWSADLRSPQLPGVGQAHNPLDDFEIIAADDSFEMIEDLEFYEWLDTAAEQNGTKASG